LLHELKMLDMSERRRLAVHSDNEGLLEAAARAAHETNRVWCLTHGDNSQMPWELAPEWQKDSAKRGVAVALGGASPEDQHKAWCAHKRADGWAFGPVKDEDKKTHPCLVDYKDLPEVQKAKDILYSGVVRAVAEAWYSMPRPA
jgi:hypothetical protein